MPSVKGTLTVGGGEASGATLGSPSLVRQRKAKAEAERKREAKRVIIVSSQSSVAAVGRELLYALLITRSAQRGYFMRVMCVGGARRGAQRL